MAVFEDKIPDSNLFLKFLRLTNPAPPQKKIMANKKHVMEHDGSNIWYYFLTPPMLMVAGSLCVFLFGKSG